LKVKVDIAREHFSGYISLVSAFDPDGTRLRN
jgi:hypothetical protein